MGDKLSVIKEILEQHLGEQNSITSAQIAEIIGIIEDDTHSQTRALIYECAAKYKLPVAASNHGYFIINKTSEFDKYMKNLDSRKDGIDMRKKLIEDNFKENDLQ